MAFAVFREDSRVAGSTQGGGHAHTDVRTGDAMKRVRKQVLACCLLAVAFPPLSCRERSATPPPNIVVILVDDLRWDDIGVAGHPFVQTPNIDRLAGEGARFLNAFATTPLCSPSRASILTGQHAHRHGIIDNTARDSASHQLSTFAIPL